MNVENPVRILHVLPSLQQSYGGPTRAVLDLSARAEAFGLHSEVIGFGDLDMPDNPLSPELIHSLPVQIPKRYCYSHGFRGWLRQNLGRFDGVVLHGMWVYPNWAVSTECNRQGVPYACFPHGMLEPWAVYRQTWWKALKKLSYWHLREQAVFEGARCVFFTTKRERRLAQETFHLGGLQLLLAPYGVDCNQETTSSPTRPELHQPSGRKVALFLGRLHPKKNIDFLIDAWAEARPKEPWHLVIAGSGDEAYVDRLRSAVSSAGLEQQVHFVGFVTGNDKRYLFQRASWFLLPSSQENFGISVLEAITNSCPVVISDQVFLADDLHEKSEVLPLKRAAWVKFMKERMPDELWAKQLVRLDQELVLPKLSIENVSREWAIKMSDSFVSRGVSPQ